MKKVFFWPYQLYNWLIHMPLVVILTLLFSSMAVIFSVLVSQRFAGRVVVSTWGRLLSWLTPFSVAVEGGENAQLERCYVVVCNHQSSVDIPVVYGWLKLDLKWVIKKELRKVPGIDLATQIIAIVEAMLMKSFLLSGSSNFLFAPGSCHSSQWRDE